MSLRIQNEAAELERSKDFVAPVIVWQTLHGLGSSATVGRRKVASGLIQRAYGA
jgi:hypothetical protein